MVELHSRSLLDSGGTFSVICARLREPESILDHPALRKLVDLSEPVGLLKPYEGAEPNVTFTGLWGAEDVTMADSDGSRWLYCGVARKP